MLLCYLTLTRLARNVTSQEVCGRDKGGVRDLWQAGELGFEPRQADPESVCKTFDESIP
jgi:hypothetical protein